MFYKKRGGRMNRCKIVKGIIEVGLIMDSNCKGKILWLIIVISDIIIV